MLNRSVKFLEVERVKLHYRSFRTAGLEPQLTHLSAKLKLCTLPAPLTALA